MAGRKVKKMFNNNANRGYVGYSMSVRAAQAYDNGEMPLSKWTKKLILERIREILYENPAHEITADDFEKLRLDELKKHVLVRSSWHHTSKYFNRTDFYSVDVNLVTLTKKSDVEKIISERQPLPRKKAKTPKKSERPDLSLRSWAKKNEAKEWMALDVYYASHPDQFVTIITKKGRTLVWLKNAIIKTQYDINYLKYYKINVNDINDVTHGKA